MCLFHGIKTNFLKMKNTAFRLHFIDVVRAFAICMMLQGHFIDGLLANQFRDKSNVIFSTWAYFRGLTAPVFFTVSGFIFMYLLAKERKQDKIGWKHVRVRKGIKRGFVLIGTMYLLRTNLYNLFSSYPDMNMRLVDVLQCIGLSLLFLISIYLVSYRKKAWVMPVILLSFTLVLFTFAPVYEKLTYSYLPTFLANYFTKVNGSVFTIFPWFGFTAFGAFMGVTFNNYKDNPRIYEYAIAICLLVGSILSFGSYYFFHSIYMLTGSHLAFLSAENTYLFSRLGNVLFVFTFFMLMRNVFTSKKIQAVGQNTLSIYIIHYIILYGTFTGYGLYYLFHHKLSPYIVVGGALVFIVVVLYLSFLYNRKKTLLEDTFEVVKQEAKCFFRAVFVKSKQFAHLILSFLKILFSPFFLKK